MNKDNVFLIYQLKDGAATRDYRFEPLANIQQAGISVDKDNYKHIYTAPLPDDYTADSIYVRLNMIKPADFAGHSPSVSDIIVMRRDGEITALYVEPVGFKSVPEFLEGQYKYYLTGRPVDIGTFPKTENGPVKINSFDNREWVENATFRAWGYVAYDAPLTPQQINDYELRPATDNPDHARPSPYQLEAQTQVVGNWERSKRTPELKCLTWYHNDFGVFVKKDFVSNERLGERFTQAVEDKTRAAAKRVYRHYPKLLESGANEMQVVGIWEDMKAMPDSERHTWHKPSIQGFALREPVVPPEKLLQRYEQAKQDLAIEVGKSVQGYAIKQESLYRDNRGFALAENPNAPEPFVTWQFTQNENGARDYHWPHYFICGVNAKADFIERSIKSALALTPHIK